MRNSEFYAPLCRELEILYIDGNKALKYRGENLAVYLSPPTQSGSIDECYIAIKPDKADHLPADLWVTLSDGIITESFRKGGYIGIVPKIGQEREALVSLLRATPKIREGNLGMPSEREQRNAVLKVAKATVATDKSEGLHFNELSSSSRYSPLKIQECEHLMIAWICGGKGGELGRNNFGFKILPAYRERVVHLLNQKLERTSWMATESNQRDDEIEFEIGSPAKLLSFLTDHRDIVRFAVKCGIERNIDRGTVGQPFMAYRGWAKGEIDKTLASGSIEQAELPDYEKLKTENADLSRLLNNSGLQGEDREAVVKARVGQSEFRKLLLNHWEGKCSVTGCATVDVLTASHIQPWSESNADEKVDVYNGLLLTPNLDKLFDRYLISFDQEGRIMISDQLSPDDLKLLGVSPELTLQKEVGDKLEYYLAIHRGKMI